VVVERVEVFGRYPVFAMRRTADLLDRILLQERRVDGKAKDMTGTATLDVPVTGDLDRILLICDGREDRLFR
jgi:hypothetical protein